MGAKKLDQPDYSNDQAVLEYLSEVAKEDEPQALFEEVVRNTKGTIQKIAHRLAFYEKQMNELVDMSAEGVRMESDLFMARTVQDNYMPINSASIGGMEIAGFNIPCTEVSGDWWYYSETENYIFLWIGDATGHGIAPALLTCAANSAMSVIKDLTESPATAMELLNNCLYDTGKGSMMMTAFACTLDKQTGQFTYSVASHDPPFIIRDLNEKTRMKDFIYLNENNSNRLGEKEGSKYSESTGQLQHGDYLILTTDGIPEARNPEGDELGDRKFTKFIVKNILDNKKNDDIKAAAKGILNDVNSFRSYAEQEDDLTLILCTYDSLSGFFNE